MGASTLLPRERCLSSTKNRSPDLRQPSVTWPSRLRSGRIGLFDAVYSCWAVADLHRLPEHSSLVCSVPRRTAFRARSFLQHFYKTQTTKKPLGLYYRIAMATVLSDEDIVVRVRDGQLEHYEVLISRYNARLFRLVYPIVGNKSEAEDVVQETHMRALKHLDQFAGRAKFATWLGRIGIYEALGRLRSRRRFESADAPGEH